ncbi:MAG: AbrB/MazE/SpoVT family DNA-binding domain-containing protein [Candidatus Acidiferrales bacterium]
MAQEVTVSPKYQIVIPREIRERLKLKPGQKLVVWEYQGRIRLEPPRPISELRGIAKGMKWKEDYRDRNDRF